MNFLTFIIIFASFWGFVAFLIFVCPWLYCKVSPKLTVRVKKNATWNRKKTKWILSYDVEYRIERGLRKEFVEPLKFEFMPDPFNPGSYCGQIPGYEVGPKIEGFMTKLVKEGVKLSRFSYISDDATDIGFYGSYLSRKFKLLFVYRRETYVYVEEKENTSEQTENTDQQ